MDTTGMGKERNEADLGKHGDSRDGNRMKGGIHLCKVVSLFHSTVLPRFPF